MIYFRWFMYFKYISNLSVYILPLKHLFDTKFFILPYTIDVVILIFLTMLLTTSNGFFKVLPFKLFHDTICDKRGFFDLC